MKKILLSLFIVASLLYITGCGKEEEEKEPATITEYLTKNNRDVTQYEFKCSALENNEIIYFDYSYNQSLMFLSNGKVYDVVMQGKTFSNGEQCKLNENFPLVKSVIPFSYEKYFLTQDNDVCKYASLTSNKENNDIECNLTNSVQANIKRNAELIKNGDVVSVLGTTYYSEYKNKSYVYNYVYYHLNTDNKIYVTILNDKAKLTSSKDIYTMSNYGKVSYIAASINAEDNNITINKLITDTGYYSLKDVETEECVKYVDVECQKLFVKEEILAKYWDSIKFVTNDLIFTKDGHVYSFYLLDIK